jgi:hypothetical protein
MTLKSSNTVRYLPTEGYLNILGGFLCWSRMQAEAGEQLEAIIARKECERRSSGGMFFWGVGNAPSVLIRSLSRLGKPIPVVFSIMKSKPKITDVSPSGTVVWRKYIDENNVERPLPPQAFVTSRAESALGPKTRHFALVCWSETPLVLERGIAFDPSKYRNAAGTGAPIGPSQVTALLKRVQGSGGHTDYEVNMRAWLVGGYWVKLTDPVDLPAHKLAEADRRLRTGEDWVDYVRRLRDGPTEIKESIPEQGLLI